MPSITINLDDEEAKLLRRKARRNLLTLKEQIEDIVRKSAVRMKSGKHYRRIKVKDRLVAAFSREMRGRRRKR